jgi:hypothetical protein
MDCFLVYRSGNRHRSDQREHEQTTNQDFDYFQRIHNFILRRPI